MKIEIEKSNDFNPEDISKFIEKIFQESISSMYDEIGNLEFKNYISSYKLKERCNEQELYNFFILKNFSQTIGFMELRKFFHISLLFIHNNYQRQGYGKRLINRAVEIANENNLYEITLNSSPNSLNAYKKIGFEQLSNEKMINGIRFYEMKLYTENWKKISSL